MNIQQDMDFYLLHEWILCLLLSCDSNKLGWNTSKRFLIFNVNLFSSEPEWLRFQLNQTSTNESFLFFFPWLVFSVDIKDKKFFLLSFVLSFDEDQGLFMSMVIRNKKLWFIIKHEFNDITLINEPTFLHNFRWRLEKFRKLLREIISVLSSWSWEFS